MLNKLIFANLGHRPIRTLLSVLAIAVEVTMILTLVGVSYGTLDGTANRARGVGADILFRPPGSSAIGLSSAPMSDKLPKLLMQEPHVTFAMGTMVQPLSGFDTINGVDLEEFRKLNGGFHYLQGGPPVNDDDMVVDEFYARQKHLHVGDTVELINHTWKISGISESGKLARLCVKLPVLQALTGNPGHLSQIFIKLDDPGRAQEVVDALRLKYPGYQIYTMEEFTSLLSINSVGLLRNFIGVVIGIAVVVGFIVVFMAMYTAVLERTREIGILKAVGGSSALILNILFRETLVLALLGSVLGIVLTYGTQWLMRHVVPASLVQETVYGWWPIATGVAIVGALLGAIVPGIKAVNQDVTEALSYE
ncbi:MAG TPA: FtsX-like permease family protein [Edaphobacter sp.]|nr:FtsX-like permease family protein [Edaphobacter sp.]